MYKRKNVQVIFNKAKEHILFQVQPLNIFAHFIVTVTIFWGPATSEKATLRHNILELGSYDNLAQPWKRSIFFLITPPYCRYGCCVFCRKDSEGFKCSNKIHVAKHLKKTFFNNCLSCQEKLVFVYISLKKIELINLTFYFKSRENKVVGSETWPYPFKLWSFTKISLDCGQSLTRLKSWEWL